MNRKPANYRAYLAMPSYGRVTGGAMRSFWHASRDMSQVICEYAAGSLLASNFNQLWCGALNMVHTGARLDYFAMQHDDVEPGIHYLDTMVDILESHDLDILGVAVPIKDCHGSTSIALARDDTNWRVHSRLTMTDLHRLPETFTSKDVGRPLLLNTGCWVCKFDMSWATQVHFEINDRIYFDSPSNSYRAQTEPEDWFFSRLLHELGLKIGCTRKVIVNHRGDADYTNAYPWGDHTFDVEYCDRSPVDEVSETRPELAAV